MTVLFMDTHIHRDTHTVNIRYSFFQINNCETFMVSGLDVSNVKQFNACLQNVIMTSRRDDKVKFRK